MRGRSRPATRCGARSDGARGRGGGHVPQEEIDKHGIEPADGVRLGADPAGDTDLAVVLGGDGTILSTLRLYAGRRVTVFAVNFGTIGFLATVEPSELQEGCARPSPASSTCSSSRA